MDGTDSQGQSHRPGLFKTAPKKHSTGRHRSKRAIARSQKGKISSASLAVQKRFSLGKAERRQRLSQIRTNKSATIMEQRRLEGDAPYLVTIISLDNTLPAEQIIRLFSEADSNSKAIKREKSAVYHLSVPRLRARFSFLCPSLAYSVNNQPILDAVRASDLLLLFWPLGVECLLVTQERLLAALLAQGLPTTLNAVRAMPKSGKQRETARKQLDKAMKHWHSEHKGLIFNLDTAGDALQILRQISVGKKSPLTLQRQRPYLVVEEAQVEEQPQTEASTCTLKVSGYLRGAPLNVNRLVHLPGWGDFQLSRIDYSLDPCPVKAPTINKNAMDDAETTCTVLAIANTAKQIPLDSEIEPDSMDTEQTWPGEDEIDQDKFVVPKVRKRVPKGTSEYQASWIIDESDGEGETDGDDVKDSEEEVEEEEQHQQQQHWETEDTQPNDVNAQDELMELESETIDKDDMDEMARKRFRQQRENLRWPDETETPRDMPARQRFQRYRGLKSFRTSPWDPKENLPRDYARIYKFADFKRTRKLALAETRQAFEATTDSEEFAHPGLYVTLHVADVPSRIFDFLSSVPSLLVVYGLLRHEHRMSVLNVVLQKHPFCSDTVIKNKDRLVFQVGCRRFSASPLFSQHTNGQKFKLERFMPFQGAFCATIFAPVAFPPTNVTVFRVQNSQSMELVAFGIVLNANPDRIILKRTVLSGHPYKVNKRTAVVRYMFYNREDIEWFKPVDLYTHEGRRGRIKQPLGTHGLMKCVFDQPLSVQDSVLMNLYKRVFPRWDYDARLAEANMTKTDGRNWRITEAEEEQMAESDGAKAVHFAEQS